MRYKYRLKIHASIIFYLLLLYKQKTKITFDIINNVSKGLNQDEIV